MNIGAPRLFLEDDLEQDDARQVLAGLRIDHLEVLVTEHQVP